MAAYRYQPKIPQDTIAIMPTIHRYRCSPEAKPRTVAHPHTPEHTGPTLHPAVQEWRHTQLTARSHGQELSLVDFLANRPESDQQIAWAGQFVQEWRSRLDDEPGDYLSFGYDHNGTISVIRTCPSATGEHGWPLVEVTRFNPLAARYYNDGACQSITELSYAPDRHQAYASVQDPAGEATYTLDYQGGASFITTIGPHHATETSLLHYAGDLDTQLDYHRMSSHRLSRERRTAEDARQAFYGL